MPKSYHPGCVEVLTRSGHPVRPQPIFASIAKNGRVAAELDGTTFSSPCKFLGAVSNVRHSLAYVEEGVKDETELGVADLSKLPKAPQVVRPQLQQQKQLPP